jgi:Nuclease-related domain/AAA domain
MARMYPEQLDPETKSAAERLLYDLFREQLDDSYVVFHAVHWLALDRHRRPRDGEADFVLAHPAHGILVLEVKGGGIRRDPRTRQWTSTSAEGTITLIKNPIEQAKDSKYSLLDQLKTMLSRYVNIGHAVAFPNIVVGQSYLGPDLRREIVLDGTDLSQHAPWVEQALNYWRGSRTTEDAALGKEGMRALTKLLGKQWEFKPALWGQFSAEQQELIRLTREQYVILDVLNRQRQAAICGFAGSGKTLLAVEKATRLARQGFRVLLTCFNRNLAKDLRERLDWGVNLDIYTFHDLCITLGREAGLSVFTSKEQDTVFFERILPDALMQAGRILKRKYDAIIVEEAQDFYET